jgi:hypothetical protein
MGLTFNNNKRQRIIKGNPREKLHLSTGTPTYWPTDGNIIPDLLDFFVNNGISSTHRHTIKLRLNLGPFPNNSNIKHISNSQTTNTTPAQLKNKLGYLQTNNTRQSKSINKT